MFWKETFVPVVHGGTKDIWMIESMTKFGRELYSEFDPFSATPEQRKLLKDVFAAWEYLEVLWDWSKGPGDEDTFKYF